MGFGMEFEAEAVPMDVADFFADVDDGSRPPESPILAAHWSLTTPASPYAQPAPHQSFAVFRG